MKTTILGRTNLVVSRMGVGAGGPSQIGRKTGLTEAESVDLLRRAFDQGVNFVDTSEGYGTEPIVGKALKGRDRTAVFVSTKKSTHRQEVTPQTLCNSLDQSLRSLGTDYIDLYNLHGVVPQDYARLVEAIYPVLQKAREQGKIRFIGISETFSEDLDHTMLKQALVDDLWDVLMVGFNILNQTARETVFAKAMAQNVGIQIMFAVRRALAHPDHLREFVADLVQKGQIDPADLAHDAFPDYLLAEATSLPDAAYRFCRDEPGVHIVLSGTGNADHLQANLASFERPPLAAAVTAKLKHLFRNVDSTTGNPFEHPKYQRISTALRPPRLQPLVCRDAWAVRSAPRPSGPAYPALIRHCDGLHSGSQSAPIHQCLAYRRVVCLRTQVIELLRIFCQTKQSRWRIIVVFVEFPRPLPDHARRRVAARRLWPE